MTWSRSTRRVARYGPYSKPRNFLISGSGRNPTMVSFITPPRTKLVRDLAILERHDRRQRRHLSQLPSHCQPTLYSAARSGNWSTSRVIRS